MKKIPYIEIELPKNVNWASLFVILAFNIAWLVCTTYYLENIQVMKALTILTIGYHTFIIILGIRSFIITKGSKELSMVEKIVGRGRTILCELMLYVMLIFILILAHMAYDTPSLLVVLATLIAFLSRSYIMVLSNVVAAFDDVKKTIEKHEKIKRVTGKYPKGEEY